MELEDIRDQLNNIALRLVALEKRFEAREDAEKLQNYLESASINDLLFEIRRKLG
jgi:hypothetical protein